MELVALRRLVSRARRSRHQHFFILRNNTKKLLVTMATSALSLLATSLLVSSLYMVLILTLHVAASTTNDNELPFLQRIKEGPSQLTWMDLIVFFVIIDLGFELLSYVTFHIGPWMGAKQIPVRGKHLDDFSRVSKVCAFDRKYCSRVFVAGKLTRKYPPPPVSPTPTAG